MAGSGNTNLIIVPSVPMWRVDDEAVFDRKFYDGMESYVEKWPGRVTCVLSSSTAPLPVFGAVRSKPEELPFSCVVLGSDESIGATHLQGGDIVLAAGDAENQLHLGNLCSTLGILCVYTIEYIPETRYQIASLSTSNPVVKARRMLYIWQQERRRVSAFKQSAGLQSNGTPAFDYYNWARNPLLYFDTRVTGAQVISRETLRQRLDYVSEQRPLRLAFSGRLIRMKGADHLVELALKLKRAEVPYRLTVYGAGEEEAAMREFIVAHGLAGEVTIAGAVDFHRDLIPRMQDSVDLFVCLHRQSDPSCTYLETLACGVPIVGYDNRAFSGILERCDVGWSGTLNDLDSVCRIIADLHNNRQEIAAKAENSVAFATQHDFSTTYQKRIDHLRSLTAG